MERDRVMLEPPPSEGLTWRERNALKMRNRVGSRFVPTASNALLERLMTMSSPERSPPPAKSTTVPAEASSERQPGGSQNDNETNASSKQPRTRRGRRKPRGDLPPSESDDPLLASESTKPLPPTRKGGHSASVPKKSPSITGRKAAPAASKATRSSKRPARAPRGRSRSQKPLHSTSPVHIDEEDAVKTKKPNLGPFQEQGKGKKVFYENFSPLLPAALAYRGSRFPHFLSPCYSKQTFYGGLRGPRLSKSIGLTVKSKTGKNNGPSGTASLPAASRKSVSFDEDRKGSPNEKKRQTQALPKTRGRVVVANEPSDDEAQIRSSLEDNHNISNHFSDTKSIGRTARTKTTSSLPSVSKALSPIAESTSPSEAPHLSRDPPPSRTLGKRKGHMNELSPEPLAVTAAKSTTTRNRHRKRLQPKAQQSRSASTTLSLPPPPRKKAYSASSKDSVQHIVPKKALPNLAAVVDLENSDEDAIIIPMPKRLKRALGNTDPPVQEENEACPKNSVIVPKAAVTRRKNSQASKARQDNPSLNEQCPPRGRRLTSDLEASDSNNSKALSRARKGKPDKVCHVVPIQASATNVEAGPDRKASFKQVNLPFHFVAKLNRAFSVSSTLASSLNGNRSSSISNADPAPKKKRKSFIEIHDNIEDQEVEELNRQADAVSLSYVNTVSPPVPRARGSKVRKGKAHASPDTAANGPRAVPSGNGPARTVRNVVKRSARKIDPGSEDDPLDLFE
ncbi:uncharacterized protein EI90DRAFT_3194917 [Cantharellus anzutake]|uniref:uncharacterized protein n=1 Tax=Cantharellus anzutake TaxID=1750568 RepID=UPI001905758A|nr:uncharacterized protein EI90DRAFT_3194917 [Cantharellus anzutake]KAF8332012.1 hypothetical protein EI90DRAFT_3194917 [Cantharellus anzutake]